MIEGDADYDTMKRVLRCENQRQVQDVLNDFKDTEFRDLAHTKQNLAEKLVTREKSDPNRHFLHQDIKTFT